jgi:nucleoside-diphosphate-sugar epimerase
MRVILLGGAGFIGRHIANSLTRAGFYVIVAKKVPPQQNIH